MTHEFNIFYKYYDDILKGSQRVDVRQFDRPFKKGDKLIFRCFDPDDGYLPLSPILATIDYVLPIGEVLNIDSELIVFSFKLT